jgi:hypothetical protein
MEMKTVQDMRKILAQEVAKLQRGKGDVKRANAINNACGKVISSVKLEMEFYKSIQQTPNIKFLSNGVTKLLAKPHK